ncbi:MAG: elongation factor Ts [Bacteroidales bacterium]|nr:elongation factor Ts [Bacteroidales bacterium]
MAITAADVNKLRQITGSGMMDCKNALVEADGDFDKAIDILRKKGQKVAAKRADRNANEGFVVAKSTDDNTYGAVIMLNCETDFVGKTADFIALANTIIDFAVANRIQNLNQLKQSTLNGHTIESLLTEMTGKTGEKIELNRFEILEKQFVSFYNHNGNRLASIVGFNKKVDNLTTIGHEIAMQIAAMSPISINENDVPKDVIEHELEIAREQVRNEGKPENMVEKIAQGKLNKFFKENTLIYQDFIRDSKKTVAQYMAEADKELRCEGFYRLQLGV